MTAVRGRLLLFLVTLLCSSGCVGQSTPTDPQLATPHNLTDSHGNKADKDSVITWAPASSLPKTPYHTDLTYDDAGLGPLYAMTRGFVWTVQPHDFPTELMTEALNDISSVVNDYNTIVLYALGFAICLVIGVLFVLIMPFVGCCFCCCRTCCKKCGGKDIQKITKRTKCKKVTFSVLLFVCTAIITASTVCMFVLNGQMAKALKGLGPSIEKNLNDIPVFVNNTVNDIQTVGVGGFDFTTDVLYRDLDSLGYLLGVPTRDHLQDTLGVDTVLGNIAAFETEIDNIGAQMININSSIARLEVNGALLDGNLTDLRSDVTTAKSSCGCSQPDESTLVMEVDFSALPSIAPQLLLLESVQSQDLAANVHKGQAEFEDIPWTVQNDTASFTRDIRSSLDDVSDDLESTLSSLDDMKSQASDFVEPTVNSVSELWKPVTDTYDTYRYWACLGLACLVGIVALFQLVGLLCGCLGTRKNPHPTTRGCVATSGGNFLMAASGFIFIFSWLLVIILIILFLVGGNLEALACRTLTDENMEFLDYLEGEDGIVSKDYLLPELLYGDGSIKLSLKDVLTSCSHEATAMSALQLYRLFDINDALDWKKHVDIGDSINNINVDFSNVNILTPETEKQLTDFKGAVNIDYQGFVDELIKSTTHANLTEFSAELQAQHDANSAAGFDSAKTKTDLIANGIYKDVNDEQTQLLQDIRTLNQSAWNVNETVDNLIASAKATEDFLKYNGTKIVKQQAQDLQVRLERIIDSYVSHTNASIFNDIGNCKPLYDIYRSLVVISFCQYTVDTLNGFWFCLGTAVFFMIPSLIFNVKLAKHFRRMKSSEEYDDPYAMPDMTQNGSYQRPRPKSSLYARNKVTPQ